MFFLVLFSKIALAKEVSSIFVNFVKFYQTIRVLYLHVYKSSPTTHPPPKNEKKDT